MRLWSTSLRWKSSRKDNQNSQCLSSKECNLTGLDRLSHLIREALWNLVTVATRNSRLFWWRVALRLRLILMLTDLSIRSIPEMLSHLDLSKVLRDRQTIRKTKLTFWSNCRQNKTKEWETSSNWMTLTSISSIMCCQLLFTKPPEQSGFATIGIFMVVFWRHRVIHFHHLKCTWKCTCY